MPLTPPLVKEYHVFLASPGDVSAERQHVRRFFDDYNRSTAHLWNARFVVIDWENYATTGVGRPQELITQQTLEKYKDSLALVVGIMGQRFGSRTGVAESGTEEEFNWAMKSRKDTGFPEIKWFFRKAEKLEMPSDLAELTAAVEQWQKLLAFRERMQNFNNPVFYTEYAGPDKFRDVFDRDLNLWLADPSRSWADDRDGASIALPAQFDSVRYRTAVLEQFDKLNFEMLDTTGAFYSVRLWSVFVPQSARECDEYNPRLLEIPKEHQKRLLESGQLTAEGLTASELQAEELRLKYFSQPLRAVLEIIDEALQPKPSRASHRLVILGDPGSGKSSLVRYLALRWASIADPTARDALPVPLVIELGSYGRWQCEGQKGLLRFLEEAPVWHKWPQGLLEQMLEQPGRVFLLLDGLDEIFDVKTREDVVNDIQRFSNEHAHTRVIVTSRVVGYQPQRLRNAEFRHFMLEDLNATQIDAFIDRWHEETFESAEQSTPKRERLKAGIRDSKSIAMLAGNPLLLTMMAILNRNQELPRDRVDLYTQASRLLLHQWDTERALADFPGLSKDVSWREKSDMLRRVASVMQCGTDGLRGNMISGSQLEGLIEEHLRTELNFAQSRAAARSVVDHLRTRNFILCFVGADTYSFVHRTFLEYFCAAEIVHQFNISRTLDEKGLIGLFDLRRRDDDWREVLRLVCGQIDELFVGQIVEHLVARADLGKWGGVAPLPELPLAIWCLSECRKLDRLDSAGRQLIRSVIALFRGSDDIETINTRFVNDLQTAYRELGSRWPGREELLSIALSVGTTLKTGLVTKHWSDFVAYVTGNREAVWALCRCENPYLPASAIAALAQRWPDETTRELLTQLAIDDQASELRAAALLALAGELPDETTRELLTRRAVKDQHHSPRSAALKSLAEKWPDETTRELLTRRAVADEHSSPRYVALQSLAEKWPDETTRALLTRRAIEDQDRDGSPRRIALESLMEKWPDETTRVFVTERAILKPNDNMRGSLLSKLAKQWPDESMRMLLTGLAVQDEEADTRESALGSLAAWWPDETTRALLAERAIQDGNTFVKKRALERLTGLWRDESTRSLLCECAVHDGSSLVRRHALELLVKNWPDETTRALLTKSGVEDPDRIVSFVALMSLAKGWPDERTRALLTEYALRHPRDNVRAEALRFLARKWPDERTRSLVTERAIKDPDEAPRGQALESLATMWPDEATRELLARRAVEDAGGSARGAAASFLAQTHSEFGRLLFNRHMNSMPFYVDPHLPLSPERIHQCAAKASIPPDQLAKALAELSQLLGWDVTVGAQSKRPTTHPDRARRKKKR